MWDETNLPFGVRSKAFIQKQALKEKIQREPATPLSEPTDYPKPDVHEPPASIDPTLQQNVDAARSLQQYAIRLHRTGKYQDAERNYRQSLHLLEATPTPDRFELARATNNLGRVLHDQQKYEEAEEHYKRSTQILGKMLPSRHPKMAKRLKNLTALYRSQGRDAEAEQIEKKLDPDLRD